MSPRKSSHRTIFLIVSSGSPLALIASSLRSTSKKPFCPMTRPLHPPITACGHRVRFVGTWREEFFEAPFNLIRDIAPVAGLVRLSLVLAVNPSVPAQTLPEFIAYAKATPGKINYASVGSGAATNVAGELFKLMAGINLVNVPYRSNYMPDLISGQVQAAFTPILQSVEHIRAGTLRALAVTGATRSESLPGIPAAAEFVPGYEASVWDALGAPANTPADIVEALNM